MNMYHLCKKKIGFKCNCVNECCPSKKKKTDPKPLPHLVEGKTKDCISSQQLKRLPAGHASETLGYGLRDQKWTGQWFAPYCPNLLTEPKLILYFLCKWIFFFKEFKLERSTFIGIHQRLPQCAKGRVNILTTNRVSQTSTSCPKAEVLNVTPFPSFSEY